MRPPYSGPSPAIADRADFGAPRGVSESADNSRGSPRGECLQPHGSILPGTARFAISVSLFQHPGAFGGNPACGVAPLPLKRRGFQKEGIGEQQVRIGSIVLRLPLLMAPTWTRPSWPSPLRFELLDSSLARIASDFGSLPGPSLLPALAGGPVGAGCQAFDFATSSSA